MAIGYIYIIRNSSHEPDVYKVGKTSRPIEDRLKELNSETTNIGSFELLASFMVSDIDKSESESHEALHNLRVQNNREFFRANISELEEIVSGVCNKYIIQNKDPSNLAQATETVISELYNHITDLKSAIGRIAPKGNILEPDELRRVLAVDLNYKIGKISFYKEPYSKSIWPPIPKKYSSQENLFGMLTTFSFPGVKNISITLAIRDEPKLEYGTNRFEYAININGLNEFKCFYAVTSSNEKINNCYIETPEENETVGRLTKKLVDCYKHKF